MLPLSIKDDEYKPPKFNLFGKISGWFRCGVLLVGKGLSGRREIPYLRIQSAPEVSSGPCCGGRSECTGRILKGALSFDIPVRLLLYTSPYLCHLQVYPFGQDVSEPVFFPVSESLFCFCGTTVRHLEQLVTKGESGWGGSRSGRDQALFA